MSETHVVILTALPLEYKAVRSHLTQVTPHLHPAGTRFEVGTVPGTSCRIALGLTGAGNEHSGPLGERAISKFSPHALIFAGVAGGLREMPLGTVVVADKVYAYHGGTSEDDGFMTRPAAWKVAHGLDQLAHELDRSASWRERLPDGAGLPEVKFGAIAAGEVVLNSRNSQVADLIRRHYNDAAAIEMEGAGIAQAGHFNHLPVAVVRGISDPADGQKTTDNDRSWQPLAAANAAAFAIELAVHVAREAEENSMTDRNRHTTTPVTHITNTAGTAAIQGAHVTGNVVNMSPQPRGSEVDPAAALKELRELTELQHRNSSIDRETLDDATAELDVAEAAYLEGSAGRKKAVRALKKLQGLLSETLDVPAKIAALIAALNGLS
ncbi:5'-methylthioadenosine/S-adenosylhomocysteine nucleosidase [Myceligenerans xiligouense]|uniref:Nucleoside phosphorylase n=1 Tax=Myceligenerans xiligouense TaxID=253184 RepID=A0A3N4ZNG5_9MICO|nr:5'-methylthioadenosine/S-adenosylhomocysteine nucleosidase [Myceligenerans xiligouense]RPF21411.1 nucleoside phosphorylase [Myceligenerans xiligouense]